MDAAVQGVCKLLLARILTDSETLRSLLLLYFHPSTAESVWIRQCLSFFFQAYGRLSANNQENIAQVFVPLWTQLYELHEQLEDRTVMTAPLAMIQQVIEWTDESNLYKFAALIFFGLYDI